MAVQNVGDVAAADVTLSVRLMRGTEAAHEVTDTVRFLAAGNEARWSPSFTRDPAEFDFAVSVTTYRIP